MSPDTAPGTSRKQLEATQRALVNDLRRDIREGRFGIAFEKGERLLDMGPVAEAYECLIQLLSDSEPSLREYALLEQIDADASGPNALWRRYLRYLLLDRLGWVEDSYRTAAGFGDLPDRYGWMQYAPALALLNHQWDYDAAAALFGRVTRSAPSLWKAEALAAECLLCRGLDAPALALFDGCIERIGQQGSAHDVAAARIWRAELLLWIGRYGEAVQALDPLVADPQLNRWTPHAIQLALGWRGAGRLKLGDATRALVDFDAALAMKPRDAEAVLWRGEAFMHIGDLDAARKELDRAVEMTPAPLWPFAVRALLRARLGDTPGFWSDFGALPGRVVRYFRWREKLTEDRDIEAGVALVKAMLEAARGLRRSESYLFPVWMKRPWA